MAQFHEYPDPEEIVRGIWQTLTDAGLIALKPEQFYELIDGGIDDETAEEAWYMFADRRADTFV